MLRVAPGRNRYCYRSLEEKLRAGYYRPAGGVDAQGHFSTVNRIGGEGEDKAPAGVCLGGDVMAEYDGKEGLELPRNTLGDLNNHLFAQLERLGEEDLKDEELQKEIGRARAITGLASQIIANGTLVLKGTHLQLEYGVEGEGGNGKVEKKLPKMLRADFIRE